MKINNNIKTYASSLHKTEMLYTMLVEIIDSITIKIIRMKDFENLKTKDILQQYKLENIRDDESDIEFIEEKFYKSIATH